MCSSSSCATPKSGRGLSQAIDTTFRNSLAETLTETEKAFQLGFVAMSEAILLAIQAVSYVVIVIIMAVMANTMAMTARERYGEYATFKALGFSERLRRDADLRRIARHRAARRSAGRRVHVSDGGGVREPGRARSCRASRCRETTIVLQVAAAFVIGLVAAAVPAWNAARDPHRRRLAGDRLTWRSRSTTSRATWSRAG